ncbi:MAG: hypothetical protein A2X18_07690 [Bacteroidetes bacterium GWF2_40_14]|nr:MAG: hypothetical protein A2X18_07690 [Bacteroidetes bacterium GWF2_40_14]
MNVKFKHTPAEAKDPVVFEQILGEKPGGGIVLNPSFDVPASTAVGLNSDGKLVPIKAYRLLKDVAADDDSIEIAKGSGVVVGDIIGHETVAVACSAVDATNAEKDVVTVTLGVVIKSDTVLFQSAVASVEAVEEIAYGYYDAVEATPDSLKVVAADAGAGEILLASVEPYKGIKNLAADHYVVLKASVAGVVGVPAYPKYVPKYLLGDKIYTGLGDQLVKLVNAANVRKETVNASLEVIALLKNIELV